MENCVLQAAVSPAFKRIYMNWYQKTQLNY